MIWLKQTQEVQINYMNKWLKYHGSHSWYIAFFLPACTYSLMVGGGVPTIGRQRKQRISSALQIILLDMQAPPESGQV